jgi:hypothetical protein
MAASQADEREGPSEGEEALSYSSHVGHMLQCLPVYYGPEIGSETGACGKRGADLD